LLAPIQSAHFFSGRKVEKLSSAKANELAKRQTKTNSFRIMSQIARRYPGRAVTVD